MEHKLTQHYFDGAILTSSDRTITADGEKNGSPTIPAGSGWKEIDLQFTPAQMQDLFIKADADINIKLNAADGADLVAGGLLADEPLIWVSGTYYANPLGTEPVTSLFAEQGAEDVVIVIRCLQDVTP